MIRFPSPALRNAGDVPVLPRPEPSALAQAADRELRKRNGHDHPTLPEVLARALALVTEARENGGRP